MSLTDEELTFKNNKSHIFNDPRANHYCFKNTPSGEVIYFFPNGKTGGTFLRAFLDFDIYFWDPYEKSSNEDNLKTFEFIKVKPLIIILRNPIKRVVSSYLEMSIPRKETAYITINLEWYKELKRGNYYKSFSLFLDLLLENNKYDVHMFTQTEILKVFYDLDIDNIENNVKHILFNETLRDDCINLCKHYNIKYNKDLQAANEGNKNLKEQISQLLNNKDIIEKINKICYEDDILYKKYWNMRNK